MFKGFDKLDKLMAILQPEPIDVHSDRCLKNFNKNSSCRACQEFCPLELVELQTLPEIDQDACTGCGVCSVVCPTGALEPAKNSNLRLASLMAKVLATSDFSGLAFVCDKNRDKPPEDTAVVIIPCAGHLHYSFFVAAASLGATDVWVDVSSCAECEFKVSKSWIAGQAQKAASLTRAYGVELNVFVENDPPGKFLSERVTPAGRSDQISRRDFFSDIFKEAASGALILSDQDGQNESEEGKRLPQNQIILSAAISRLEKEAAPDMGRWPDFASYPSIIEDKCNACENCALYCPTGALSRATDEDERTLVLRVADCVGCGLCEEMCDQEALVLGQPEQPFSVKDEIELIRYGYRKCANCGVEFGAFGDEDICRFCKKKSQMFGFRF